MLICTVALSFNFRFNENGEFTILQLTDQHYCSYAKNESINVTEWKDRKTHELSRRMIQLSKPDLIVLSGDAVTGKAGAKRPGEFEKCWDKVAESLLEAQIPYAYILGNHDAEGYWNRRQIVKFDYKQPLSVRKDSEGIPDTCNFMVPVFSSRNDEELAANVWFFDSGSQSCDDFDRYTWGCIERDAVDWYNYQSQKIKDEYGTNIHHLAFLHIPLPEYAELWNSREFYGDGDEMIGCPNINTGFFESLKKNGDISATFVGHDHTNNMGGWYDGVELIYGQKSGYGFYGDLKGARVVKLKENYNEQGELNVTRNHFIIFENETISYPEATKREPKEKISCEIVGKEKTKGALKKAMWTFKRWIKSIVA